MKDSPPPVPRQADTYAAGFALLFPTLAALICFVLLDGAPARLQQTAYVAGKLLQFAFPLFWVLALQRARLVLKLPRARGLPEGIAFGVAVSAAGLLVYYLWFKPAGYLLPAGEPIRHNVVRLGVTGFWSFFAMGAFFSIVHSFLEEYYWRWFVFGQLRRLVSLRAAILVSSLGFMGHHVVILGTYFGWASFATVFFSFAVAVGGAVWAWIYHRSQSLYAPWLSHLLIDAAIFAVGYDLVRHLLNS